jgi:hypothetical protein
LPVLLVLATVGCGGSSDRGGERPSQGRSLAVVRTALRSHRSELARRYRGYLGSGIGAAHPSSAPPTPADRVYVIEVYLRSGRDRPRGPQSLAGVPIRFVVTGVIRAQ